MTVETNRGMPDFVPTRTLPLPTRIAFIGNHLPRQCGIATFTTDLCSALAEEFGEERLFAIPVNDPGGQYEYPERVRLELEQEDIHSYERGADFLNFNENDLVCLQHEYGIFGGPAGAYVLTLLRKLRMPIVTTLHTVLREPNPDQKANLREIGNLSDRVVVMSQLAALLLEDIYEKERFDQQPVGACATISGCITAYRISGVREILIPGWYFTCCGRRTALTR